MLLSAPAGQASALLAPASPLAPLASSLPAPAGSPTPRASAPTAQASSTAPPARSNTRPAQSPTSPASLPQIAVEINQGSLTTGDSYFQVRAEPGALAPVGTIELLNRTSRPVAVTLDPVHGTTGDTLGWVFSPVGEPAPGSAQWLRLGSTRVSLGAHASRTVPVAVAPIGSAGPGDYLSGVSVQSAPDAPASALSESVIPVESLVPGQRSPHVSLSGASVERAGSSLLFSLRASNNGNVLLKHVRGRVTVTEGARVVLSAPIGPGTFVAHTGIEIPFEAHGLSAPGGAGYRVRAQLFYKHYVATLDTPVTLPARPPDHVNAAAPRTSSRAPASRRGAVRARARTSLLSADVSGAALILVGALLATLLAAAVRRRRRRRLLPRQAMLKMLERTLGRVDLGDRPLSFIHVAVSSPSRSTNRRLAAILRRGLRRNDVVGDLWKRGLLIMLPNTTGAAAEDVWVKLKGRLADACTLHLLGAIEIHEGACEQDLGPLVHWLRVRGLGVLGRGRGLGRPGHAVDPRPAAPHVAAPRSGWTARLEELLGASLADIGSEQVEGLAHAGVSADADLQFRAALYRDSDDGARELCSDIAAMRNDRGGVIVLGVADLDGVAVACPEVALNDHEEQRMQRLVAAGTSPPAWFHVRAVGGSSPGKGFYLLIAEPSPLRPHAVLHDSGLLYPRRDGGQTRYLGEVEVADLYRDRFRGELEQIERLRAITSDLLEPIAPGG